MEMTMSMKRTAAPVTTMRRISQEESSSSSSSSTRTMNETATSIIRSSSCYGESSSSSSSSDSAIEVNTSSSCTHPMRPPSSDEETTRQESSSSRRRSRHSLPLFLALVVVLIFCPSSCLAIRGGGSTSSNNRDSRNNHQMSDTTRPSFLRETRENDTSKQRKTTQTQRLNVVLSTPGSFDPLQAASLLQEQDQVWSNIASLYPQARKISATHRINNALYLSLPESDSDSSDLEEMEEAIRQMEGVKDVTQAEELTVERLRGSVEYFGGTLSLMDYCVTGKGIRVAILDSGVDYTHEALGGNGTQDAYYAAYGMSRQDAENTQRGDSFPTERVVDGWDALGDALYPGDDLTAASPDNDPIDGTFGHGTGVAHALLAVASEAEIVAIKVCITSGGCPDFAIVQAFEFALDPNGDGNLDDKVDIINMSLGLPYTQAYFSLVAKAIEDAFALGVLTVVSAGNSGNVPQIMIGAAATPNALAVGATGVPETDMEATMALYSSRGPGDVLLKPDISAPGGKFSLAAAALGHIYFEGVDGTSYSAPIVAGAAALIKQYCPECSPFAIKTILMNNAVRNIRYNKGNSELLAPVSWLGAGELQVHKALTADFWAFCVQDAQPSVSLGVHNVVQDFVVTKTIRLVNINNVDNTGPLPLTVSVQWRDPADEAMGAVEVVVTPEIIFLGRDCGTEADVQVEFRITASKVPSNHMTTAGKAGTDPKRLDANEFDGWIVIASSTSGKDISLPFHMILRRSANVAVQNPILPALTSNPQVVDVGLENTGAGTAQIDTYQLVYTSGDDPEFGFGSRKPSADLRYVGYRVRQVDGNPRCSYLVEFAFHTWERTFTAVNTVFEALLDLDGDLTTDIVLSNHGPHQHKTSYTECRIYNVTSGVMRCAGYAPEHHFDSSNTVIRACAEDLGLLPTGNSATAEPTVLNVRFATSSFATVTHRADSTSTVQITFPEPALSGPSFDVLPSQTWNKIEVRGTGSVPNGAPARGLLLLTNAWRSDNSTGASRRDREAIPLTFGSIALPQEVTADDLQYPRATVFDGPICDTWKGGAKQCSFQRNPALVGVLSLDEIFGGAPPVQPLDFLDDNDACPEFPIRTTETLATQFPTPAPMGGGEPTFPDGPDQETPTFPDGPDQETPTLPDGADQETPTSPTVVGNEPNLPANDDPNDQETSQPPAPPRDPSDATTSAAATPVTHVASTLVCVGLSSLMLMASQWVL